MHYLLISGDKIDIGIFVRQKEQKCCPLAANPGGSAASMYEGFSVGGRVKLQNPVNLRDVYTTSHDISAD